MKRTIAMPIRCQPCGTEGKLDIGPAVTPSPGFVLSAMRAVRCARCGAMAATR